MSSHGDPAKLLAHFAALLAAASALLAFMQAALAYVPRSQLALAAWSDEEFLISTTMAVVGIFSVLAWDSAFPDRNDGLILGLLPIRPRTILRARLAAMGTGLGISIIAVNAFTGLAFPFSAYSGESFLPGVGRTFLAYWITMIAAGLFVFCALLAAQGLAAHLFSYRWQGRISNILQIVAFFLILSTYFLTPGSEDFSITDPNYASLVRALPSFWFLGLLQKLHGAAVPNAGMLAARALFALGIAAGIAISTHALAYRRNFRRTMEQPDLVPDRSRPPSRFIACLARKLLPNPVERAVALFIQRTLARSRQHRLILAAYAGLGLAISLTFARALLFGGSRMYEIARRYGLRPPVWNEPNSAFMTASFVLLFFTVIGTRAVFSLPAALKANWIFRITGIYSPKAYFTAVRKSMYGVVAWPVLISMAAMYLAIWPRIPALLHIVVMWLSIVIVVERALTEFRKIPFTCSYLPGQANLRLKLGAYGTAFLFATYVAGAAEKSLLETVPRAAVLFAILIALAIRSRGRWAAFAAYPYERLQFESVETREVSPLDLSHDGVYSRMERYVDVMSAPAAPSFGQRVRVIGRKTILVAGTAALAGFLYQHISERLHPLPAQIGQRVDIGGRSLNIFCSGEGQPAVIFESGMGGPGITWGAIQHEIAKFARTCWYDRAGYGWSDPGPFPRDSAAIAEDLHRLLRNAGVAPPYVLVGASFGGLTVRVYKQHYTEEVAGMVLVDSSHVDENLPIRPFGGGWLPYYPHAMSILAQVLRQIGVLRLIMDSGDDSLTQIFEPRTLAESSKELFYVSLLEARAAGTLGDRPLIVLTAGLPSSRPNDPAQARELIAAQQHWIEAQAQLARLSTRGKQIVLKDSRHGIQTDRPDAVIDAVFDVIAQLRY